MSDHAVDEEAAAELRESFDPTFTRAQEHLDPPAGPHGLPYLPVCEEPCCGDPVDCS